MINSSIITSEITQAKTIYGALHGLQVTCILMIQHKLILLCVFCLQKLKNYKCLYFLCKMHCRLLANYAILTSKAGQLKSIWSPGPLWMTQDSLIEVFWLVSCFAFMFLALHLSLNMLHLNLTNKNERHELDKVEMLDIKLSNESNLMIICNLVCGW